MNMRMALTTFWWVVLLSALLALSGCSIRKMAMESVADALSGQGTSFSADDDPELVGDALPFALKLMESVRSATPDHKGLHLALCSGFVQYAYGWVLWPADQMENKDFNQSQQMKQRAHKLFLRAMDYGARGLELSKPEYPLVLQRDGIEAALALLEKEDVPQLYWYAAALAMAIKTSGMDTDMIQRLSEVGLMLQRAATLEPDWGRGTIQEALISYYSAVGETMGGGEAVARPCYEKALALSEGKHASLYLAWAEGFALQRQDKDEFIALCNKCLAVEVATDSSDRLANEIAKRRAVWLLNHLDDLFLD